MQKLPNYLYRGDKVGNKTLPEHFYSDGLFSKLLQGGNPSHLSKEGIYNSIKAHILPITINEFEFYKKTHFLSFSESKEIALYYTSDKKPDELIAVPKYRERRYLFSFNLFAPNTRITEISQHIFQFSYQCNRNLIEPISFDTPELTLLQKDNCSICSANIFHNLIIFDVASILKANSKYQTSSEAYINSKRDKEWLILPFDYDSKLMGYSSRIPRADFWSAELFRLKSESEKSIEESLQGIIL